MNYFESDINLNAIVLGGSRGIGKAISTSLESIDCNVKSLSRTDLDTSDLTSIEKFLQDNSETDVLILNTGGPPAKDFKEISREEWNKYHNQLFLGFCTILQNIKISDGGYIFLISSNVVKEPESKLILSCAYRAAFNEVFKILSKNYAKKNISCINIAPGPINTDRTKELVSDLESFKKLLPMNRLGEPKELGDFVSSIIQNNIKYLTGVTINFDGGLSNYVF